MIEGAEELIQSPLGLDDGGLSMTYKSTFTEPAAINSPPTGIFFDNVVNWAVLYSSLILATLLWCTILIVYHIMRVGGAAGRMHVYQRAIEMLVESASLYSAVLVVLVVLEACNERATGYIEEVTISTRVSGVQLSILSLLLMITTIPIPGESYQQFWSAVLQQGMRAQMTLGAKIPWRHQFGSEIIRVCRMARFNLEVTQVRRVSALLDLNRANLHA